jgi:DNA-binding transcriptional LysR family regulator
MFASLLPVKTFPLPFEAPPLHEILLWHKRHESDPAHRWLRDLVVRLAQEL